MSNKLECVSLNPGGAWSPGFLFNVTEDMPQSFLSMLLALCLQNFCKKGQFLLSFPLVFRGEAITTPLGCSVRARPLKALWAPVFTCWSKNCLVPVANWSSPSPLYSLPNISWFIHFFSFSSFIANIIGRSIMWPFRSFGLSSSLIYSSQMKTSPKFDWDWTSLVQVLPS